MIQSVQRAARLLMLVAAGETGGRSKDLAGAAGLTVSTAHHLLSTLVEEGFLAKDAKSQYLLGTKVEVLAAALQRAATAPEYMLEPLRQLAGITGETSYLASWRQGDIRMLASVEGHHPVRVSLPLGPYSDGHVWATGKLLLAMVGEELRTSYLSAHPPRALTPQTIVDLGRLDEEFERIRRDGYALDDEEFQSGVSCAAAPVIDEGIIVAAYSISAPTQRFHERKDQLLEAVVGAARLVTDQAPRELNVNHFTGRRPDRLTSTMLKHT